MDTNTFEYHKAQIDLHLEEIGKLIETSGGSELFPHVGKGPSPHHPLSGDGLPVPLKDQSLEYPKFARPIRFDSFVTNTQELREAFGTKGIHFVKPGKYGYIRRVRSADVTMVFAHGAVLAKGIYLTYFDNIRLVNPTFDASPSDQGAFPICTFLKGSGLTIIRGSRKGHWPAGQGPNKVPEGSGLSIVDCSNVVISEVDFSAMHNAVGVTRSSNVNIYGCRFHELAGDSIVLAGVVGGRVSGNVFGRQARNDNFHADAIQSLSYGVSDNHMNRDIEIDHNVMDNRYGTWFQDIFANNERRRHDSSAPYYEGYNIHDNLILGAQLHGISFWGAKDFIVKDNTLMRIKPSSDWDRNNIDINRYWGENHPLPNDQGGNEGLITPSIYFGGNGGNIEKSGNVIYSEDGDVIYQD